MEDHDVQGEMNQLFSAWSESQKRSIPELFDLVYRDLRQIAQAYMRRERPNHTLQTTALINEAYLRMFQGQPFRWENRKHVFCIMAQTMRRVLVDYARSHHAYKRGGEQQRLSFDNALLISAEKSPELFALDEALERLVKLHIRQGQVVELRFFGGLTIEETAAILDISPETVKLDWRFAKAWLQRELSQSR
jgi:RNA polymerase sigma factor (TIGR02999 family)